MRNEVAAVPRQVRARRIQLLAAAVGWILYALTARELSFGGVTLSRSLLIAAAAVMTLICCMLFTDLRRLRLSEATAMGAAPSACFILLGGAAAVPGIFLISFALCMLCYFGLRTLFLIACGRESSRAVKQRCHSMARAWTLPLIGAAVILLAILPAFSVVGGEVLLDRAIDDREELLALYAEELRAMEDTRWLGYGEKERLDALEAVAELECRWLGIEAPELASAELGEDVLGQYDNKKFTVYISSEELMNESAFTCITTLLHELRHCYQFRVVESVNWEKKSSDLRYYSEAEVWRGELMSYVSGTHEAYEEYYEQAIEADARAYAKKHALDYTEYLN
ncbi:MAG: hypothetical protein J6I45_11195 [Clostridia bacterium]|nr:hypothetical protein [Clostridia bacterium]